MSVVALSEEQRLAWKHRVVPPNLQLSEGIRAIPVPFPDNPLTFTYCYAISEPTGVTLVDPGAAAVGNLDRIAEGLRESGYALSDINGIALTHYHMDHIGMVRELLNIKPNAWVAMHEEDIATIEKLRDNESGAATEADQDTSILTLYGIPRERHEEVSEAISPRDSGDFDDWQTPRNLISLGDSGTLPVKGRTLRYMWTPGHTYGHVVFYDPDAQFVITGDHVLPSITPHIGMDARVIARALSDYYDSLARLYQLGDDYLVFPAHGFSFTGLQSRIDEIRGHHKARLDEIEDIKRDLENPTTYQVAERLSWARGFEGLSGLQLFAALVETSAHLHFLNQNRDLLTANAPTS